MLRFLGFGTLALALVVPPVLAANKPPVSLTKTGKWEINYDKEACHLFAKFGDGNGEVISRMTRYQPGDSFDLTLYGRPFESRGNAFDAEIDFGLGTKPIKRTVLTGVGVNQQPIFIISNTRLSGDGAISKDGPLSAVTPEAEARAKTLSIKWPRDKQVILETGSLAMPMKALRKCVDDLVRSWGYDPTDQAAMTRRPEPLGNPGEWATTLDYPASAMRQGNIGIVQFRLDVGADGKVAGCHVLYRTNPDEFADLTCQILSKRARFKPALDRNGMPARSFWISKVRWMLPS